MRDGLRLGFLLMRRPHLNLNNINIPKNPILSSKSTRNIMSQRIPPRRESSVGSQEVSITRLELNLRPFPDGLPLKRGIKPPGQSLEDLPTSHAEKKRLVRSGEVLTIARLEADYVVGSGDRLDSPSSVLGESVSVLGDRFLIIVSVEVLVVVATETHGLGIVEELHSRSEVIRKRPRRRKTGEIQKEYRGEEVTSSWFFLLTHEEEALLKRIFILGGVVR